MGKYPKLCKTLEYLVDRLGPIEGRTRLIKMLYLADVKWATEHGGQPYTEARYYRWNNGPFAEEILRALEWMDGIEIVEEDSRCDRGDGFSYRSGERSRLDHVTLDPEFLAVLDAVDDRWHHKPSKDLIEYVYRSARFKGKTFGEPLLT
jgi:hypothetical protein